MFYIPQIILFLSLLGILLIIGRKIPTLMKFPRQPEMVLVQQSFLKRLFHFRISMAFIVLINWLEKLLRKSRIVFLKIDNFISQWIQKAREKSQVLTIRYQAWLAQHKIWRLRVKNKEEDGMMADTLKAQEQAYIKLLAQDPKNAEIYRRLGNIYLVQKNYQDARQTFEQVLILNPQDKKTKAKLEQILRQVQKDNFTDQSISSTPS